MVFISAKNDKDTSELRCAVEDIAGTAEFDPSLGIVGVRDGLSTAVRRFHNIASTVVFKFRGGAIGERHGRAASLRIVAVGNGVALRVRHRLEIAERLFVGECRRRSGGGLCD